MSNNDTKITVGVKISESELSEFRAASHVDTNATAILAMARKGLEATREVVGECEK